MAEEQPSNPVGGHSFGQWAPGYPPPPQQRSRFWPTIAVGALVIAVVAAIVAVAALVVAATPPPAANPTPIAAAPTYNAAEKSAARQNLCDTYGLAARAVGVDTNGTNPALARIALTNAATMLDSANTDPAIGDKLRNLARALAAAYRTLTAKSSSDAFTELEYRAALNDVAAKDTAMKKVCGSG